ncbi:alpha/beta hydrolase fold domain-containing protein [Parapedobacter sp. ISTM3]|uniref:alpha/beta hydrolase fold domain-containing protein n=1 Tax=Parapedobacter sp. ISTM3 TaxID=2800130 RepID=UPI001906A131|nr:alpha/beta hydrolase fold domain-containing protein [Parapedobacter sp. ISTM3]MBK1438930.1 alpha/beta hydrolase fold domain-containing protein [Parapedobacter sp. ISTM3]
MRHYVLLIFTLLVVPGQRSYGQGMVSGTVTDQVTQQAVAGVRVLVKETGSTVQADESGRYRVQVSAGLSAVASGAGPEPRVPRSKQLARSGRTRHMLDTVFRGWCPLTVAPNKAGLTGIRDTGFTPEKEFQRMLKSYPFIRLVREQPHQSEVVRDVPYGDADNWELVADIYPAEGVEGKAPAVLLIFGGGWRSGDKRQLGPLAQRLAAEGFSCVTIDYRLSTHALYPAAVCDVKTALRWMHKHADSLRIDPHRIAVLGFSAGGQLAALAGTTAGNPELALACGGVGGDRVQAIIDIDGILAFIHPESGEGDDTKSTSAATYWFGYTKYERPDLWVEASPLTHVSENTPPTLFINSSVDRMHAGRDDFIRVLDEHGIYHERKVFADAPHSFCLFEPWFTPMLETITAFLNRVMAAGSTAGH